MPLNFHITPELLTHDMGGSNIKESLQHQDAAGTRTGSSLELTLLKKSQSASPKNEHEAQGIKQKTKHEKWNAIKHICMALAISKGFK